MCRKNIISIASVIAAITFIAYTPSLWNGFVNWDDHIYVYENDDIRSINIDFLKQACTSFYFKNWHPFTMISYALDHAVWEMNPFGYHLTNVILHSANTFLVLLLIVRLIAAGTMNGLSNSRKGIVAATVTALLFGIHPIHVESVAWISERKDVLYAFFYLLSILAYIKYAAKSAKALDSYSLSLIFFVMALMSKPMAVSLPLVLIVLDYYPLGRLKINKAYLVEKMPFIIFSVIFSFATVFAQGEAIYSIKGVPVIARILIAIHALAFYLLKTALPTNLAPIYPFPREMGPFDFDYVISTLILLSLIVCCILPGNRFKFQRAALLFYILSLFPVLGFVQVGGHFAADRYTYLPSLGPFLIAGLFAGILIEHSNRWYSIMISVLILILFVILAFKTFRQIGIWHDSITLWTHEIELFPDTAAVAYNNRGQALMSKGSYYDALTDFKSAIEVNPILADAYYNLGAAYLSLGRYEEAIKQGREAVRLSPNNPIFYSGLGKIYFKQMRFDEATKYYQTAITLKPDNPAFHNDLANVYYKFGYYDKAILEYMVAVRLKPKLVYAHFNLGKVYLARGLKDEAREKFEAALRLEPNFLPARQELALIGD